MGRSVASIVSLFISYEFEGEEHAKTIIGEFVPVENRVVGDRFILNSPSGVIAFNVDQEKQLIQVTK